MSAPQLYGAGDDRSYVPDVASGGRHVGGRLVPDRRLQKQLSQRNGQMVRVSHDADCLAVEYRAKIEANTEVAESAVTYTTALCQLASTASELVDPKYARFIDGHVALGAAGNAAAQQEAAARLFHLR